MLDEAGFWRAPDGVRFWLSLSNYPVAGSRTIAEVAVQQSKRISIDARWEQFDTQTRLTPLRQGNFDISTYFVRYGSVADADREYFATGAPRNFMEYSNPELNGLLEQARRARARAPTAALRPRAGDLGPRVAVRQ